MTKVRMVDAPNVRDLARHVVKFTDGSYLGYALTYELRVVKQKDAHRWLTWASAKMIADSTRFHGTGARAVRLRHSPCDRGSRGECETCMQEDLRRRGQ